MSDACSLCGLQVSRRDLSGHLQDVIGRAGDGRGAWLLTLNTEMLARSSREPAYWDLLKKADIVTADGMPLVWASAVKSPNMPIIGRTTGVDLVDALLRLDQVPRFAVIGGLKPLATIERYGQRAVDACAFVFDGKVDLSEQQLTSFGEALNQHQVRVVFIALGVPKQDQLAVELRQRLPHLVLMGVGGTFEILGPQGHRAPRWMQRSGLEWMYRLIKEPGRLWRRYLVNYPRGIWFLLKDCLASGR